MRFSMRHSVRWSLTISAITFGLAFLLSIISSFVMAGVSWGIGLLVVLLIVLIGVFFDMLGIAATSADEKPFHAMAAERVSGAKQAIRILRNADQFSNFCNDVVGDISGIVSGAASVAVVTQWLRLIGNNAGPVEMLLNILLTSVVAAVTVGGKALGKSFAIHYANDIIFRVGQLFYLLETRFHIRLFDNGERKNRKKG